MYSPSKPRLPKQSSGNCADSLPVAGRIRQPQQRSRPKFARRKKAERKTWKRMKLTCRAAFFLIAIQKKRWIERAFFLIARRRWIRGLRSSGEDWLRLTSGLATMVPKEVRGASTII